MSKKIKKILILSLTAAMIVFAEGESNSSSEINEIIRKSESEKRKEQKEAEREERKRAREEEKERKRAEKQAEKEAKKSLYENGKANQETENNINTETQTRNQRENINPNTNKTDTGTNTNTDKVKDNINNTGSGRYNNGNTERAGQNRTNANETDINSPTENTYGDSEINQILNIKKQEKRKSKIDKSKPVVIAEDREKETGNQYKDSLMKYIATKDGKILKKELENRQHPIASLTKVMNIIVALDEIDKGNAGLEDRVCFSPSNANIGGSWLNVKAGDCFMLRDLLRAEIIYSANNASYLVAEYIGKGNIEKFVELMNEKARELGMNNTKFYTPAGLPTSMTGKEMDVSTAYDMYLMGKKAIEDSRIREWGAETELVVINSKGEQVVYPTRNHLLGTHGIYGLKTGFHNLAGFNIIVSSQIGNIEIISVVLGHKNDNERTSDQKNEFANIEKKFKLVYPIGYEIGYFKVRGAEKKKILGIISDNIYRFADTDYEFKIKELKLRAKAEGIKKGDIIGKLEIVSGGNTVSEVDIFAAEETKQLSLWGKIVRFITFGLV